MAAPASVWMISTANARPAIQMNARRGGAERLDEALVPHAGGTADEGSVQPRNETLRPESDRRGREDDHEHLHHPRLEADGAQVSGDDFDIVHGLVDCKAGARETDRRPERDYARIRRAFSWFGGSG